MAVHLSEAQRAAIAALEPDLRTAAEAIGIGTVAQLASLAPGLTAVGGPATLTQVSLDPEGEPDPLSLAAIVAAHDGYVRHRGTREGVSTGALAIARLLVWASRAAVIGPTPTIAWIGPETRAPADTPGTRLRATATVTTSERTHTARAVVIITGPPGAAPSD